MRIFAQRSIGVGETCFYEIFRTNGGFGELYGKFRTDFGELCFSENFSTEKQRGFGGLCSMRSFAEKQVGLGGLCFYEVFRTEKQRGFGGTVFL